MKVEKLTISTLLFVEIRFRYGDSVLEREDIRNFLFGVGCHFKRCYRLPRRHESFRSHFQLDMISLATERQDEESIVDGFAICCTNVSLEPFAVIKQTSGHQQAEKGFFKL